MKKEIMFGIMVLVIVGVLGVVGAETTLISDAGVEYEVEVLEKLNKTEWIPVIIEIYFENSTIIDQVLSNLLESEFKLKKKLLGNDALVGNITKEGFNKVLNNPNVRLIYLSRIAQIHPGNEIEDEKVGVLEEEEIKIKRINLWLVILPILAILLVVIYLIFHKKK